MSYAECKRIYNNWYMYAYFYTISLKKNKQSCNFNVFKIIVIQNVFCITINVFYKCIL